MADVITHYSTARRFLDAHPAVSGAFARGLCFGSQGPDLFFFGVTKKSAALARAIHAGAPAALFETLAEDLAGQDDLSRGYALGVLLHYFGDRGLHPYVGWYCRVHATPYVHVRFETAIDLCVYERTFGAPISSFDYGAVFRRDRQLVRAVHAFWNERLGGRLRRGFIIRCLIGMSVLTRLFVRARPGVVRAARVVGELAGNPQGVLAHFKCGADADVMNDSHEEWLSPTGPSRESVEDILCRIVSDFTSAYDALAAGTYRFDWEETFSYGA